MGHAARALIFVDSDLVIDWLRGHGPGADAVEILVVDDRLRLSAVTAFELRQGADFVDREREILLLLRDRVLSLDLGAALRAAELFARLARDGRGIGLKDCFQAGTCLQYGLALATRNRRHFKWVDGLVLADLSAL